MGIGVIERTWLSSRWAGLAREERNSYTTEARIFLTEV
jgi:hypothetical protein